MAGEEGINIVFGQKNRPLGSRVSLSVSRISLYVFQALYNGKYPLPLGGGGNIIRCHLGKNMKSGREKEGKCKRKRKWRKKKKKGGKNKRKGEEKR